MMHPKSSDRLFIIMKLISLIIFLLLSVISFANHGSCYSLLKDAPGINNCTEFYPDCNGHGTCGLNYPTLCTCDIGFWGGDTCPEGLDPGNQGCSYNCSGTFPNGQFPGLHWVGNNCLYSSK